MNAWRRLTLLQIVNFLLLVISFLIVGLNIWALLFGYLFCFIFCGVGLYAGYHRSLSHGIPKKFRTKFYISLGILSGNGPPVGWAATHRGHHKHSDLFVDPHVWERGGGPVKWQPWRGLWLKPGCPTIDNDYAKKIYRIGFYRFVTRYYYPIIILWIAFLCSLGPFYLLTIYAIPAVFGIVTQTAIVSLSHRKGKPVNNVYLWPLMWGECFHLDHHNNPGNSTRRLGDPVSYLV